jgi:integrase/recombinase XerC/integrase/recombinase XerD
VDLRTLVPSHPEQADQVAQLLDAYGLFCEANLAVSTVRVYRSALGLFFRWWKAHHPRLRLAPPLLHHYKKWLMTATDERGEALSARTINNYLAAVRAFCAWLKRHEKIAWEAGAEIPDVRVDNKTHERRPLSPAQVTQLMGTFDDSLLGVRDAALCYLMVKTGIRAVQVERADWGDLEQTEHGWILKTQGKGQRTKEHFVLVLPEVMARLERYRVARGSPGPREPLFIGHHEALTAYLHLRDAQAAVRRGESILEGPRRLTIRAIQLRITRAMAAIGVREAVPPLEEGRESLSRRRRQRRVTPHSLRHTAASEAAKTSSPFQVQTMLDHKDVRTTQKYFHALNRLEEGAERAITSY